MTLLRRHAPESLLGLVLAAAAALLLALNSGFTFFQDTWAFLLDRQDFSARAFFEPHNEHIVVIPVAIEKVLIAVFGMTSAWPEMIVLTLLLLGTAALLFVYVRRRLGPWPALLAATVVLFLGPAWQVLLWPFEISLVGSTLTGLAMLLALDREDRRGDIRACLLLTLSIGFSSLGVAFAAGALVDVLLQRRRRGLGRLYVAAIPLAFYALWYLTYGHDAKSAFSFAHVLQSPVFLVEGLSASLGALTGLTALANTGEGRPYLGFAVLLVLVALFAYAQRRRPGISPRFWPVAGAATTFWLLAAFNKTAGREAPASRYVHVGAIFVLLMAADLLKGARIATKGLLAAAAVAVFAVAVNIGPLSAGADWLDEQSVLTRADTGAIDIASRTVAPYFGLVPQISGTGSLINVNAAQYLPAVREHGSPGYSPAELARAPGQGRRFADIVLSVALPLSTKTVVGEYRRRGGAGCVEAGEGGLPLFPGATRIEVAPGPHASFNLRRFATGEFPVATEGSPGASTTTLRIPSDKAPQPWVLQVEAEQPVRVCRY
ncbi:MAG TPA: hypothetical protein VNB59_04550 [Solirubrobacterales bacterium]|jgi:hypothetical protein|nr:hypothetical protein [Solirubrobacterales bacterium]